MNRPTRITKEIADAAYAKCGATPRPEITVEGYDACPIGAIALAYCDLFADSLLSRLDYMAGFGKTLECIETCVNAPVMLNGSYAGAFAAGFDSGHLTSNPILDEAQGYADGAALRVAYGFPMTDHGSKELLRALAS